MWTGAEPGAQPSYPRPGSVAGRLKWATPICPARLLMTAFRTEPKVRQRTYIHTLLFTSHSALSNHPKEKCQINHLRRVSQSGFCLLTTVQTRYKPGLVSCRPLIGLIHIHSFVHPPCDTYFPKPASLYCRAVKQTNYHPTITIYFISEYSRTHGRTWTLHTGRPGIVQELITHPLWPTNYWHTNKKVISQLILDYLIILLRKSFVQF